MTPGLSVGTDDGWIHDVWGRNFTYTDDVTIYFFNTSVGKDIMDPMDYGRHYLKDT